MRYISRVIYSLIALVIFLMSSIGHQWLSQAQSGVIVVDEPPGGYVVARSPVIITGTVHDPSIDTVYINKVNMPVVYLGRLRPDLPGVPFPVVDGRFTGRAYFLTEGDNLVRVIGIDGQGHLHQVDVPVRLDPALGRPDVRLIVKPKSQREAHGAPVEYTIELRNRTSRPQSGTYEIMLTLPDGSSRMIAEGVPFQLAEKERMTLEARINPSDYTSLTGDCALTVTLFDDQRKQVGRESFAFETYDPGAYPFVDVTRRAGLRFLHRNAGEGGGLAWADYDNDGYPDLFVTNLRGPSALFHNNGDGTFTNVIREAGLSAFAASDSSTRSAAWADYDNDGYKDLFIAGQRQPSRLYHNNGDGTFTDVTIRAIGRIVQPTGPVAWGDYDNDGWLDLYVAGFLTAPPSLDFSGLTSAPHYLFHNNGDGTFTDIAPQVGLNREGPTWAALWLDYDGDGDLDLYIVNDFGGFTGYPNTLYRNDGPGGVGGWIFTNIGRDTHLSDVPVFGMGLAAGDYDHDDDVDLFVSNIGLPVLYQRQGDVYRDATMESGVGIPHPTNGPYASEDWLVNSWGSVWWDYDLDGWIDLYVASSGMGTPNFSIAPFNPNFLFRNNRDGTFTNVAPQLGINHPGRTRGVALADYDRDGDLDLALLNNDEYLVLYRNDLPRTNHWLQLALRGTVSNRDAIGALIIVEAGDMRQVRPYPDANPMCSQNTLETVFGVGQAEVIDRLEVRWPSGKVTIKTNVAVDQRLILIEPEE